MFWGEHACSRLWSKALPLSVKQGHWQVLNVKTRAVCRTEISSITSCKGLKKEALPMGELLNGCSHQRPKIIHRGHSSAAFSRPLSRHLVPPPHSLLTLRINVSGCSQHPVLLPSPKLGLCRPSVPTLPLCLWPSTPVIRSELGALSSAGSPITG